MLTKEAMPNIDNSDNFDANVSSFRDELSPKIWSLVEKGMLNIGRRTGTPRIDLRRKDQCGDPSMQTELERMQKALERERKLNMRFQLDQASQTSYEEEMDQVRRQFEANKNLVLLKKEIEEFQVRLNCENEENGRLSNVAIEKDAEIKALKDEWDKVATEIANYLQALDDASEQMDNIMDSFPQRILRHAHKLASDTEEKIRSLKEDKHQEVRTFYDENPTDSLVQGWFFNCGGMIDDRGFE
eukprot:Gb_17045 [translate_table: standard]